METKVPFYRNVICTKARGGKNALWCATKSTLLRDDGGLVMGVGNTADNAIRDLQRAANAIRKRFLKEGLG